MKKNISPIKGALEKIQDLNGVYFEYNGEGLPDGKQLGFIAQECREVVPEVVSEKDGVLGIQYGNLAALLTEGMKEQQEMINELKRTNGRLQEQIRQVRRELDIIYEKPKDDTFRCLKQ